MVPVQWNVNNIIQQKKNLETKKDKWSEDIIKRLGSINQRLRQKSETKACIKPFDKAIFEYYPVFSKRIKFLSPESQLSDFYYPSEG